MTVLRSLPLLLVAALLCGNAQAQSDDKSAQKAARRTQLQLQNLQQQVQDAQAAKTKVEAEKAEADKLLAEQTQQAAKLDGALRKSSSSLRASESALAKLSADLAALEKQLAAQKSSSDDALAQKAREMAQFTKVRDEQQAQLQGRHDAQVTQVTACTAKNGKLIALSAELLDRYRNKGVADVFKQREPLLGLGDVGLFNEVQDYRDRADAERYAPPPAGAPASR